MTTETLTKKAELIEFLSLILKIKKDSVIFTDTYNTLNITVIINKVKNTVFGLSFSDDTYCCGITAAGNTGIYHPGAIGGLSTSERAELYQLLMDYVVENCKERVEDREWSKGLLTWSHTDHFSITHALLDPEYTSNPDRSWKESATFHNPNSGNTVVYFIADISDGEDHDDEGDDDDDY